MQDRHNALSLKAVESPSEVAQTKIKQAVKDKRRIAEIRKELSILRKELSVVLGLPEAGA